MVAPIMAITYSFLSARNSRPSIFCHPVSPISVSPTAYFTGIIIIPYTPFIVSLDNTLPCINPLSLSLLLTHGVFLTLTVRVSVYKNLCTDCNDKTKRKFWLIIIALGKNVAFILFARKGDMCYEARNTKLVTKEEGQIMHYYIGNWAGNPCDTMTEATVE